MKISRILYVQFLVRRRIFYILLRYLVHSFSSGSVILLHSPPNLLQWGSPFNLFSALVQSFEP